MNICADCARPVGSCSWEKNFTPVPGWVAEKTQLKAVVGSTLYKTGDCPETYAIKSCPLFVRHPKSNGRNEYEFKPILAKNIATGEETLYPSLSSIKKTNEFCMRYVVECLDGKSYSHYGHSFEYISHQLYIQKKEKEARRE